MLRGGCGFLKKLFFGGRKKTFLAFFWQPSTCTSAKRGKGCGGRPGRYFLEPLLLNFFLFLFRVLEGVECNFLIMHFPALEKNENKHLFPDFFFHFCSSEVGKRSAFTAKVIFVFCLSSFPPSFFGPGAKSNCNKQFNGKEEEMWPTLKKLKCSLVNLDMKSIIIFSKKYAGKCQKQNHTHVMKSSFELAGRIALLPPLHCG